MWSLCSHNLGLRSWGRAHVCVFGAGQQPGNLPGQVNGMSEDMVASSADSDVSVHDAQEGASQTRPGGG